MQKSREITSRLTRAGATRVGFTLIELLMVMAILTIVMAVLAPKLFNFAMGRRVNDEGTDLVSMANYARTQAISEGRPYRLNFDTNSGSFWLTAPDDTGAYVPPKDNDFGQHVDPPDGVTLQLSIPQQQDGVYINFLPTGRCDPGTIVVRDNKGASVTVTCQSATELYHVLGTPT